MAAQDVPPLFLGRPRLHLGGKRAYDSAYPSELEVNTNSSIISGYGRKKAERMPILSTYVHQVHLNTRLHKRPLRSNAQHLMGEQQRS